MKENNIEKIIKIGNKKATVSHSREILFKRELNVVRINGENFLIGVELAQLLNRETFNMYRSMKIKNIGIERAQPEIVSFLIKATAVPVGTHSVTLVPYPDGLYFVADIQAKTQKKFKDFTAIKKRRRRNKRTFIQRRPTIHRRKPAPWDIHRSLKENDLCRIDPITFKPIKGKLSKINRKATNNKKTLRSSSVVNTTPKLSNQQPSKRNISMSNKLDENFSIQALSSIASFHIKREDDNNNNNNNSNNKNDLMLPILPSLNFSQVKPKPHFLMHPALFPLSLPTIVS
eukprot:TRINITY_DN594_c0_g5_i2.p1 TRINITY_DN594_c0_g5~~TRINITY_DN594_c0_g5_i2.p1  ORF type:complete len:288 (+),score=65.62 TRINITY_DN594_c0_g5_i2:173-1036(+)